MTYRKPEQIITKPRGYSPRLVVAVELALLAAVLVPVGGIVWWYFAGAVP